MRYLRRTRVCFKSGPLALAPCIIHALKNVLGGVGVERVTGIDPPIKGAATLSDGSKSASFVEYGETFTSGTSTRCESSKIGLLTRHFFTCHRSLLLFLLLSVSFFGDEG